MTFLALLRDFNLAVWYGIAIRTCTCILKKIGRFKFGDLLPNRQIKLSAKLSSYMVCHTCIGSLMEEDIEYFPCLLYGSSTPLLHVPVKTGMPHYPHIIS